MCREATMSPPRSAALTDTERPLVTMSQMSCRVPLIVLSAE
nr:TPA_asm: m44.7 sORF 3 [Murid betaherpesvirus 1]DBA07778.1 TPA_asm: m44.7 sORF 3 [Murid betaherpesvirus 1]